MAVVAGGVLACAGAARTVVETFPRGGKHYLVCYPFEGRLAHQTLGMLLTRRLERARAKPLGFVANEYALAVWSLGDMSSMIRQDVSISMRCSMPTCWATIWKRGSRNPR
jgi:Lhr-like helicase